MLLFTKVVFTNMRDVSVRLRSMIKTYICVHLSCGAVDDEGERTVPSCQSHVLPIKSDFERNEGRKCVPTSTAFRRSVVSL